MAKIYTTGDNVIQTDRNGNIDVLKHATPWLTMRDKGQQKAFDEFRFSQSNMIMFSTFQVVVTAFLLFNKWSTYEYYHSHFSIASLVTAVLAPSLAGFAIIVCRLLIHYKRVSSSNNISKLVNTIKVLECLWFLGTCVTFNLSIINIAIVGRCDKSTADDFGQAQGCSYSSEHQMPEDMMIISVMLPILFTTLLKSVPWGVICFAFTSNFFTMLFTMIHFDLTISTPSLLIFSPMAVIVLYEMQRHNIALFLITQKEKNLLAENERLAAETHANELRHMIGNVAHDLKTPLSAFMSGMDLITSSLSDITKNLAVTEVHIGRGCKAIEESLCNMKNVNDFMLMTINRCIDYTKASQGLKLVPRLETISFLESINLPMSCMRNLQESKIEIKLLPVSAEICSHIITDKQWLQENILCLLSNAVKYSAGGTVTISATLQVDNCRARVETAMSSPRLLEPSEQKTPETIALKNFSQQPFILIEIEDTGVGIDPEAMKTLFAQFKQAQRLTGGTGLGLYSLAKRVETLGGAYGVNVRHDGSQGSLFWFSIPYRPDDSILSLGDNADSSVTVVTLPAECRKLNILLVDDSLSILKMSSMVLRKQGHNITTAENGAIALKYMGDQYTASDDQGNSDMDNVRYDVVLMDLQMPVMDGFDSTRRLRKLEAALNQQAAENARNLGSSSSSSRLRLPYKPTKVHQLIIGVSANSDSESIEAAFTAGVDAFIPKPFTVQSFNETFNKAKGAKLSKAPSEEVLYDDYVI